MILEQQRILVDGHVHYHPCFEVRKFLDSAIFNFSAYAGPSYDIVPWIGCLMFADTRSESSLSLLSNGRQHQLPPEWRLERTTESSALLAFRNSELALVLIAGRQIQTAEGLELLALGTDAVFDERQPFLRTLKAIVDAEAIPVIPWGFGKWTFKRGKLLDQFFNSLKPNHMYKGREIFLGDNAGRTSWIGEPRLFRFAKSGGIRILPGSDPLPVPSHSTRPGSYGFILNGAFNPMSPVESLKRLLATPTSQPKTFGRLEMLHRFVSNQIAMQFHKGVPALSKIRVR